MLVYCRHIEHGFLVIDMDFFSTLNRMSSNNMTCWCFQPFFVLVLQEFMFCIRVVIDTMIKWKWATWSFKQVLTCPRNQVLFNWAKGLLCKRVWSCWPWSLGTIKHQNLNKAIAEATVPTCGCQRSIHTVQWCSQTNKVENIDYRRHCLTLSFLKCQRICPLDFKLNRVLRTPVRAVFKKKCILKLQRPVKWVTRQICSM